MVIGKVGRQSSGWCFEVTGSECGVEKSRESETLDRETPCSEALHKLKNQLRTGTNEI